MQGHGLILAGFQRGKAVFLGEGRRIDFKGIVAAVHGESRIAAVGLVDAGFLTGSPGVVELALIVFVVGILLVRRVLIRVLVLLQIVLVVREADNDILNLGGLRVLHAARIVIADAETQIHVLTGITDLQFVGVVYKGVEIGVDIGGLCRVRRQQEKE